MPLTDETGECGVIAVDAEGRANVVDAILDMQRRELAKNYRNGERYYPEVAFAEMHADPPNQLAVAEAEAAVVGVDEIMARYAPTRDEKHAAKVRQKCFELNSALEDASAQGLHVELRVVLPNKLLAIKQVVIEGVYKPVRPLLTRNAEGSAEQ